MFISVKKSTFLNVTSLLSSYSADIRSALYPEISIVHRQLRSLFSTSHFNDSYSRSLQSYLDLIPSQLYSQNYVTTHFAKWLFSTVLLFMSSQSDVCQ